LSLEKLGKKKEITQSVRQRKDRKKKLDRGTGNECGDGDVGTTNAESKDGRSERIPLGVPVG
jgi:hypothetical protein